MRTGAGEAMGVLAACAALLLWQGPGLLSQSEPGSSAGTVSVVAITDEPPLTEEPTDRRQALSSILSEHGVQFLGFTDVQPCDHEEAPFVDEVTGDWRTTGCHTADEGVRLSMSVLSPVVPWADAEYLALHEAAHETETLAGCPEAMGVEDRERLADAVAVRWGADPTVTTNGPTRQDYQLADHVLSTGTCQW